MIGGYCATLFLFGMVAIKAEERRKINEKQRRGSLVADDVAGSTEQVDAVRVSAGRVGVAARVAEGAAAAAEPSILGAPREELGEGAEADTGVDDLQKHYELGVGFREMSLLDEAIGEFLKVVKGAQKGKYPPSFLQACTLLATCFMDKNMPAIAAKWYARALETPNLAEEALLALQYDLGLAYEQAGDKKTALEKFSEVYSQNIDYRDVAEKIRALRLRR